MNYVTGLVLFFLGSLPANATNSSNTTTAGPSTHTVPGVKNDSQLVVHGVTCSEQCSEQELNYCTGFGYPMIEEGMTISCNTKDQQSRDRNFRSYIDSALAGRWKNLTVVFQELLTRVSPSKESFPLEYFGPDAALLSVLEGHRMSNSCNVEYLPLKELVCSWMYVSPCDPEFKICQDSCETLMKSCFPTAVATYDSKEVLNFVCSVLSDNNNSTDCKEPDDVYSEERTDSRRSHDSGVDMLTIISASSGVFVLLLGVLFFLAALRYYLGVQGFVPDDMVKLEILDPLFERGIELFGKTKYSRQLRAGSRVIGESLRRGKKDAQHIDQDAYDLHSLNSSASTFYCQTDQSISTIAEVLPPETIYFESVLSSRWKSSEDEVVALVSWIDGMGNKNKGVIKCYTDKRRRQMEEELNVISQLSHANVCEYMWRSMSTRPHVRSMTPHLQSVMSLRNNFFCTEYYSNGSLKDFLIDRGHYLKDSTAQSFFRDIVAGMCYLHDQEVFHRDLKTTNVLVGTRNGKCGFRLVISDFGLSQDKARQDCYVRNGSGGTSQYTSPEVLLSTGTEFINLYKADVYSMALVAWEVLSYVCCRTNEVGSSSIREEVLIPKSGPRCTIQSHTAFGTYLLNRFPDLTSTSASSSVVRDYMRSMYRSNIHFRPIIPDRWPTMSPAIKTLVMMTRKMWSTEPSERLSAAQLARAFNLTRYNSRLSLTSKGSMETKSVSSVLCTNTKTLS